MGIERAAGLGLSPQGAYCLVQRVRHILARAKDTDLKYHGITERARLPGGKNRDGTWKMVGLGEWEEMVGKMLHESEDSCFI